MKNMSLKKSMHTAGLCALVLSMAGCVVQQAAPIDQAMAEHSSTCLKSGHAIKTKAHADCVIALHENKKKYQKSLEAIAPAPVEVKSSPVISD